MKRTERMTLISNPILTECELLDAFDSDDGNNTTTIAATLDTNGKLIMTKKPALEIPKTCSFENSKDYEENRGDTSAIEEPDTKTLTPAIPRTHP